MWPREIREPVVISAGLPLVLSCDTPPGPPKPETYWMTSCNVSHEIPPNPLCCVLCCYFDEVAAVMQQHDTNKNRPITKTQVFLFEGTSGHLHTVFWLQAHTRDRSTGRFRPPSPPCSRCGRTAGCPWVWTETCISPTSSSTTLSVITAATPDSRTKTPFNRRCPWLWKLWQVSDVVWQHDLISVWH